MAPAVKLREIIAARAGGAKPSGSKALTTSTPAWKAKLQCRTPTSTPAPMDRTPAMHDTTSEQEAAAGTTLVSESGEQNESTAAAATLGLKLTFIQAPLLPQPELSRPPPASDRSALLRQLQDLRTAGSRLLQQQQQGAAPSAPTGETAGGAENQQFGGFSSGQQSTPSWPSGSGAFTSSQQPAGGGGGASNSGLYQTPHRGTSSLASPAPWSPLQHTHTPVTPRAQGHGHGYGSTAAVPRPCLSPPSLAGLRQQESQDTGGGFLTHYAHPRDLATPTPGGAGGGGAAGFGSRALTPVHGGGGGGLSTPLSALRTIDRVQQLQRKLHSLQREGAQLLAGIGRES